MEKLKLLPETTRLMLNTIGIKKTLELVEAFGGSSFAVPEDHLTGSVYNALSSILGENTRALMEIFRGKDLVIPHNHEEIEETYLEAITDSSDFFNALLDYQEILPATAKELVEVIGIKDAIELIKRYGGNTMLITCVKHSYAYQDLAEVLSAEKIEKIKNHYKHTRLYIPKCEEAMIMIRNREFWKAVEKLIIDLRISQERAIFLLGPRFGITYRQAFNIKKEMSTVRESKQQALI